MIGFTKLEGGFLMTKRKSFSDVERMSEQDVRNSLEVFYGIRLDEEQKKFRDAIWDESKRIVFCNARSGTGKTTIALGTANLLYHMGNYNKIVYIVSPTMEQKVGYLPGNTEAKFAPYIEPLFCALSTLGINPITSVVTSDNMESQKMGNAFIYAISHTYLRGMTLDKSIVIIDEFQNAYISEAKKVLTRIKDDCKVVVIGHTGQVDLFKNPKNSGFLPTMNLFKSKNDDRVAFCELTHNYRGWISSVADELESEISI